MKFVLCLFLWPFIMKKPSCSVSVVNILVSGCWPQILVWIHVYIQTGSFAASTWLVSNLFNVKVWDSCEMWLLWGKKSYWCHFLRFFVQIPAFHFYTGSSPVLQPLTKNNPNTVVKVHTTSQISPVFSACYIFVEFPCTSHQKCGVKLVKLRYIFSSRSSKYLKLNPEVWLWHN